MSQEHSEVWKEAWETSFYTVTRIKALSKVLRQASSNDDAELSAHTVEEIATLIEELSDKTQESLGELETMLRGQPSSKPPLALHVQ